MADGEELAEPHCPVCETPAAAGEVCAKCRPLYEATEDAGEPGERGPKHKAKVEALKLRADCREPLFDTAPEPVGPNFHCRVCGDPLDPPGGLPFCPDCLAVVRSQRKRMKVFRVEPVNVQLRLC